jgi:predicted phage terminase large subunit-like protein
VTYALEKMADPRVASAMPANDHAYFDWQARWYRTARTVQIPPEPEEQADWLTENAGSLYFAPTDVSLPWNEMGYMAGRGFGKTRVGAEWLGRVAVECTRGLPYAVVAPTQNDVRMTCFEGMSGLRNTIPEECIEKYSADDLRIILKNGATIRGFSAEKAERLRGPEHAAAWCDEIAAWGKDAEYTLDMLQMGLRLGERPRLLWTSTPKPNALVRNLTTPRPGRLIVCGSTYDNKANLAGSFFDNLEKYSGTNLGRQELYGELIDPEEAGIIRRSWFRLWPAGKPLPRFDWIIMSLDTAYTEKSVDTKGDPDPTACSVWGVFQHEKRANVILLDCWEDHLGLPDLMRRVRRELNTAYGDDEDTALIKPMFGSSKPLTSGRKPDILLIEDKGSGISLRQMLAEAGIEAYAYNPGRADKLSRLHIVSPVFAQKRVWLPESDRSPGKPRTWADPLVTQLCSFTGEGSIKHDDLLDSCTQALRLCMDKGLVSLIKQAPVDNTPPKQYINPYSQ